MRSASLEEFLLVFAQTQLGSSTASFRVHLLAASLDSPPQQPHRKPPIVVEFEREVDWDRLISRPPHSLVDYVLRFFVSSCCGHRNSRHTFISNCFLTLESIKSSELEYIRRGESVNWWWHDAEMRWCVNQILSSLVIVYYASHNIINVFVSVNVVFLHQVNNYTICIIISSDIFMGSAVLYF